MNARYGDSGAETFRSLAHWPPANAGNRTEWPRLDTGNNSVTPCTLAPSTSRETVAATESTGGEHRWVPGVTRNSLQAAAPADEGPRRSVRHQAVDQHPPFDHRPSGQRLGWLGALTLYVDISGLLDGTLPEPPAPALLRRSDGHKLIYAGQVNLVFGDPESGKTWICLAAATEALKDGRRVLVIDLDHNGAEATVHRLLALGAPEDRLRDPAIFRYCEPEDRTELRRVVKDTKKWRPAVAVVDSIGELLPLRGANSNNSDEFTTVHTNVLKPLAKAGAAVLAVDHLAKSPDSRAQGPGGTAAKRRAIGGVSVRVKARRPITPGRGDEALLVVNKDRTAECERTARLVTASLSSALSGCLPSTTGFLNGSSGHLRTGSETTTRQRHRMTSPPSPRLIHHRRRSTTAANAWDGGSSAQPTHYERGVNLR